jgi:uncharacterized membrane protein
MRVINRVPMSRQMWLLIAISAVGILLRFAAIDRSYWFDEIATLNTIDVPNLVTVLDITSKDNQPPFYNSMAFGWANVFGFSEIAVRSLSAVFGLLALGTPWLARRSLDRSAKLLVFTILCLMPLPIRYAQEARNYSLLFLLSSTCLFCYYEILAAKTRRLQLLFHVSLILLAFSHLFGLLLAVSFIAAMFWRERRAARRLGLMAYAAALSAAIIVPLLYGGSGRLAGGNFWITFTAGSLALQLLLVFTPAGIALLIYALVARRRHSDGTPFDPALVQVLAPFALMFVGSVIISFNTPILTERNLIGLVPAYALLTAWLLRHISSPHSATATAVLLCLLLVQAVVYAYSPYQFVQEDFRSIAKQSIATNSRVCYYSPNLKVHPDRIAPFYVSRLYHRPDLEPQSFRPSEIPQDLSTVDCHLWADADLPKRGVSFLRTLPQFSRCTDVPLAKPGRLIASELLNCGN